MSDLEKKLSSGIEELIDEVITLYPNLTRPLVKIRRMLERIAAESAGRAGGQGAAAGTHGGSK